MTEKQQAYHLSRIGKKRSPETIARISAAKMGAGNAAWKGDAVGYSALHNWIRKHKPVPKDCEDCGKERPLDAANISGEYKRDLSDWKYVCRECHTKEDGRIKNLKQFSIA